MPLEALQALCAEHKACHDELQEALKAATPKASTSDQKTSMDEQKFVRFYSTTQESLDKSNTRSSENNCFRESVTRPSEVQSTDTAQGEEKEEERAGGAASENVISATGLQHITLKQALNAASPRLRDHLPLSSGALTWSDMVEAAWKLRPGLHISQKSWSEACLLLGRTGATVCLILTDQGAQREKDRVMKPGAYFHAMINKAKTGELHLHKSIFGILKPAMKQPDKEKELPADAGSFRVGVDQTMRNSGLARNSSEFTRTNGRSDYSFRRSEIRKALPNRSAFLQSLNPADLTSIARHS